MGARGRRSGRRSAARELAARSPRRSAPSGRRQARRGRSATGAAAGAGAASPAIQAAIAAWRGSPAGSGAPPACICPAALVSRRLDCGRLRIDERAHDRLVPGDVAREQKPRHPRGATRPVAGGADAHQDRMHRGRERRSTWRRDRRRGCRRSRRRNGRRDCGNRLHRRRERRGLGRPRLVALALAVSLRRARPGSGGGFLVCRVIEARAGANPGQHPLVRCARRGPGRTASVQRRARGLLEELARLRVVDVREPRQHAVVGLRIARQDQRRGGRCAARCVASLAGREEQRVDRPGEGRSGRRGGPAAALSFAGGRSRLFLRRRLGGGSRGRPRRRCRWLLLEPELIEDVLALLFLGALGTRDHAEPDRHHHEEAAQPAASAHRRGTWRKRLPGWRTPSGRRDIGRRTSPRSSPGG